MELKCIPVGIFQTNCYLWMEEDHVLVIDPGDGRDLILRKVQEAGVTVDGVIVTHGHMDHFSNASALAEAFDCPIYYPKKDVDYLSGAASRRGPYVPRVFEEFQKALEIRGKLMEEGQQIRWRNFSFELRMVSGHTDGGMCLYEPTQKVLFAGDCLFQGSIGRTDLYDGEETDLLCDIRRQLFTLPPETVVYPGHGPKTTILKEISDNPFF